MRILFGFVLAFSIAATLAHGGDWPQFRGPGGAGLPNESQLPTEWSADSNVKWKVAIPGAAWSCPVVVGDKVFVTTAITENQRKPSSGGGMRKGGGDGKGGPPGGGNKDGAKGGQPPGGKGGGMGRGKAPDVMYQWRVLCLDRNTGKILWNELATEAKPRIATHSSNTYASETPVIDGDRLYAYFGMTGLYCYDLGGKLIWKKDLGSFPMQNGWGTSSSPVIDEGRLFIQCDNEQESFVAAFDAKDGKELWRESRPEKSGWATPLVWRTKDRTDLVVPGSQRVRAYEPATGKVVWELNVNGGQASASPVATNEMLYFGTAVPGGGGMRPGGGEGGKSGEGDAPGRGGRGGGGMLFAVKAGAKGDISLKDGATSNDAVAWMLPKGGPPMSSPLVYQGFVYVLERNGGMVNCYDAKTGKAAYTKERIPNAKAFWASPWAYDGKVFCLDEDGQTHVLKAGDKFEVVNKNTLGKDLYWATPAASSGALYFRGIDNLLCVSMK